MSGEGRKVQHLIELPRSPYSYDESGELRFVGYRLMLLTALHMVRVFWIPDSENEREMDTERSLIVFPLYFSRLAIRAIEILTEWQSVSDG